MTRSVCYVPRCPAFAVFRGRCATHRQTTSERGYDRDHMAARRALGRHLPAPCAYGCGTILHRGSRWVAAHVVDGEPARGWVAACAPCNERAKHGLAQLDPGAEIVHLGQTAPEALFA